MELNLANRLLCLALLASGFSYAQKSGPHKGNLAETVPAGEAKAEEKDADIEYYNCSMRDVVRGEYRYGGGYRLVVNRRTGVATLMELDGQFKPSAKATLKATQHYGDGEPVPEHFEGGGFVFDVTSLPNGVAKLKAGLLFQLDEKSQIRNPFICGQTFEKP